MARKRAIWFIVKAARITGWVLLVLVALYLSTGFSLCGKYGVDRLIESHTALTLHRTFDLPLLFFLLVHALTSIYLSLRRWGWLKR